MSCADGEHNLRAVNPFVHPTELDSKGKPLEIIGAPPQTQEEPAWCLICGAMWNKRPFGLGWGFLHPATDTDAPTLGNIIRGSPQAKRIRHCLTIVEGLLALRTVAPLSERTEAEIAFLQESLWEGLTDLERNLVESRIETLKADWPDAATTTAAPEGEKG